MLPRPKGNNGAVEERPSSVYDALRPRETLVGTGILLVTLILWVAVVSPLIEDRAPWAATPWPPMVLGMAGVSVYFVKRQRREWNDMGIASRSSRRIAQRAMRTGRLPEDPSHDDEIRALVTHTRLQYGDLRMRGWVIALVCGVAVLVRGIRNDDVIDLGLAAVCVCLAPVAWWSGPRGVARWDRLIAALDARSPAPPPEAES